MMPHLLLRRPRWLLGALLIVGFPDGALFAADAPPSRIEASEPRAQIRAEILKATQLGAQPVDVLEYIRKNLHPDPVAVAPVLTDHPAIGRTADGSDKKGVQSIRLVLGRYLRNPALFLMEIPLIAKTTTTVQWAFDKQGNLIEVFVDKDSEIGDQKSPEE